MLVFAAVKQIELGYHLSSDTIYFQVFERQEFALRRDSQFKNVVSPFRKVNAFPLRTLQEVPKTKRKCLHVTYLSFFSIIK